MVKSVEQAKRIQSRRKERGKIGLAQAVKRYLTRQGRTTL